MTMECPICNEGKLEKRKVPYSFAGAELGEFDAEVCGKCGETFFTEEASAAIEAKAKEMGIWGIGRSSKIGYAGNALIVRIPKNVAAFMGLKKEQPVFIHPEGKRKLVIETR